ncbi:MAG: DUF1501 domain-containing protein, partial [Gemmataceae bacterium]
MHPFHEFARQSRRDFFATSASGVGLLAVAEMLRGDRLLAEPPVAHAPGSPHFPARAKNCICIYLEGGPSQIDLFDPKPKLNELHGQKLPESLTKNVRFAFIQKDGAVVLGCPRKFKTHGECGMELGEWLPHLGTCADDICLIRSMHTDAFNHHPGQLLMNTGAPTFGRPSMGSWINYGLGSASKNLPGYVVLISSGVQPNGGKNSFGSGFLPSVFQGVQCRSKGDPVLYASDPPGMDRELRRKSLDALRDL